MLAQGYYDGVQKVWIPKKQTISHYQDSKAKVSGTQAPITDHPLQLTRKQKGKWVPKKTQPSTESTNCPILATVSTSEAGPSSKDKVTMTKELTGATTLDNPLKIQVKLFGMDYHSVFTKMRA